MVSPVCNILGGSRQREKTWEAWLVYHFSSARVLLSLSVFTLFFPWRGFFLQRMGLVHVSACRQGCPACMDSLHPL